MFQREHQQTHNVSLDTSVRNIIRELRRLHLGRFIRTSQVQGRDLVQGLALAQDLFQD